MPARSAASITPLLQVTPAPAQGFQAHAHCQASDTLAEFFLRIRNTMHPFGIFWNNKPENPRPGAEFPPCARGAAAQYRPQP